MRAAILGSLILLLSSCSILKVKRNQADDRRIVIVGAGISGLAAAYHLKENGFQNVLVLEAQSQIGGRLKTDRTLGLAFDEGASWIHGPKGNPISELAEKAGVSIFLAEDDNIKVYDIDGSEYDDDVIEAEEAQYEEVLEELKGDRNRSFGEVFFEQYPQYQNNRLWTYMLSAFLEFDTGGDIFRLSSLDFYDDEEFRGDDLLITDGYDQIAEYLARGVDIKLNSPVMAIDYAGPVALVRTQEAEYEADFVIVSVPLGVLKRELISFQPALPKHTLSAINRLEMGTVNKFLLTWDTAFWDTNLHYIGYTPEDKGQFNLFLNAKAFTNTNALITFAYGDYGVQTEEMSNEVVTDQIMSHLKAIYGNDIPLPKQFLRTRWHQNEYTFGAYSFATNGTGSMDFKVFREPVDNKLFFAGEHTTAAYRGTVHGAYLSGVRAARQIMKIGGRYTALTP